MDLTHGFLPSQDPCQKLPKEFAVLEEIAADLPKLLMTNYLRSTLENLPEFPIDVIKENTAVLERAMMLFSFLGHAYVWGKQPVAAKIPRALALPWYKVAKHLQRPPVLSYSSYALHNWRRINANQSIELGNIALLQNFLGGMDEEWFVLVHVDIEAKAIPALQAIPDAQQAVVEQDNKTLNHALKQMMESLQAMCNTMERMPEHCDPYIYYNRVRPYIHGWKDNAALPNGILYESVTAYHNQPQKFRGETGAQSSIIPSLDAVLGIVHQQDPLRIYLQEMRDYMPLSHRQFIQTVEQRGSIRDYVKKNYHQLAELRDYYNQCVELITHFRTTHLHYAAKYIQQQQQISVSNPTATGTGGTPFMAYLKKHKDEAKKQLL